MDKLKVRHTKQDAAQTVLVQGALEALRGQQNRIRDDLQRMLESPEGQVLALWNVDSFTEQVIEACRPGLFLSPGASPGTPPETLHTTWKDVFRASGGELDDASLMLFVDGDDLLEVQAALSPFGPLCLPDLSFLAGRYLAATMHFERFDWESDFQEAAFIVAKGPGPSLPPLLSTFRVGLTPPGSDTLFPDLGTHDLGDRFYWGRVETYEKCMDRLRIGLRPYIQVGGWGAFMQGGDDRRYVAQVNADIGDAGSLYVASSDGHLGAEIEMG
ncbi:MAG: hypothetical protein ACYDHY_18385 [Acidiferrobacterales bacterium]